MFLCVCVCARVCVCVCVLQWQIPECKQLPQGEGLIIPCLIENFENITTTSCQKFLNKMANIIFSDFRFIYRFASKCKNDIDKFQCGRLHPADDDVSNRGKNSLKPVFE